MIRRLSLLVLLACIALPLGCCVPMPPPPRPVKVVCPTCGGSGGVPGPYGRGMVCPRCRGKGRVWKVVSR